MKDRRLEQITDKNGVRTHRWKNASSPASSKALEGVSASVSKRSGPVPPTTAYHVTTRENLNSILKEGLKPSVGPRSEKLDESNAIFVFDSRTSAEDGVGNWLGEEFDDDEELILLEVDARGLDLSPSFDDDESFEWTSSGEIPADRISVVEDANL